jgi:two-component system C4-dicarboxylate transport sensor histidine kinase DctB
MALCLEHTNSPSQREAGLGKRKVVGVDRLALLLDCLSQIRDLDPADRLAAASACLEKLIPQDGGSNLLEVGPFQLKRSTPFDEADHQLLTLVAEQLEIPERRQKLAHSSRVATIGELSSALVHELSTPLSAVGLAIEGALARPDWAETRLQRALHSVQQMKAMVARVLRFARDDRTEFRPVDLNEAACEALELVGHQLMIDKITVQTRLNATRTLEGHPLEIQQILTNLLLNARDAVLTSGERKIELSTFDRGFTVRDWGCGFVPSPQIFEAFFTTKPVGQGTGLGLSVVADLIRQHGGRIETQSSPGQGAQFRVTFP